MQWIKEEELVDSVDELRNLRRSIQRYSNAEILKLLDARIASALNRIIHNSHFKKKGQSGGNESSQRRPFPSRKTDRLLDLRILPGHWGQ